MDCQDPRSRGMTRAEQDFVREGMSFWRGVLSLAEGAWRLGNRYVQERQWSTEVITPGGWPWSVEP